MIVALQRDEPLEIATVTWALSFRIGTSNTCWTRSSPIEKATGKLTTSRGKVKAVKETATTTTAITTTATIFVDRELRANAAAPATLEFHLFL